MTISALTGNPGEGKTLHAVGDFVIPALKDRRKVVTNVPLNMLALSRYLGFDVEPYIELLEESDDGDPPFSRVEDFTAYESWAEESGTGLAPLYVVDECHEAFEGLVGQKGAGHPITKWFAKHRHKGADVVLITQDRAEIPPSIKRRIMYVYEYRRLGMLGFGNRYVKHTYFKRGSDPIDTAYGKMRKEHFPLYQSRRKGVAEKSAKHRLLFNRWQFWFLGIGIAISTYFMLANMPDGMPGSHVAKIADEKNGQGAAPSPLSGIEPPKSDAFAALNLQAQRPDVIDLQSVRVAADRKMYEAARLSAGGVLVPSSDGTGATYRAAAPEPRHFLEGSSVQIVGHIFADVHTYWFKIMREGSFVTMRGQDLAGYGYSVMVVDNCGAYLKWEGESFRLSCEAPMNIEREEPAEGPPALVEYDAAGGVLPSKPVAASELRLAP